VSTCSVADVTVTSRYFSMPNVMKRGVSGPSTLITSPFLGWYPSSGFATPSTILTKVPADRSHAVWTVTRTVSLPGLTGIQLIEPPLKLPGTLLSFISAPWQGGAASRTHASSIDMPPENLERDEGKPTSRRPKPASSSLPHLRILWQPPLAACEAAMEKARIHSINIKSRPRGCFAWQAAEGGGMLRVRFLATPCRESTAH